MRTTPTRPDYRRVAYLCPVKRESSAAYSTPSSTVTWFADVEDLREAVATLPTAPAFVEPHAAAESSTASALTDEAGPPADQS